MNKSITVRDVPDDVVRELAARAAGSGRSLQEYLRGHLIDVVSRPDITVWLDRVHLHKEATGSHLSAQDILVARDSDRA